MKTVQEILTSPEQAAKIHERLDSLLSAYHEAKDRQAQADRDARDTLVAYEREWTVADRVGCVDAFKHPRKP